MNSNLQVGTHVALLADTDIKGIVAARNEDTIWIHIDGDSKFDVDDSGYCPFDIDALIWGRI